MTPEDIVTATQVIQNFQGQDISHEEAEALYVLAVLYTRYGYSHVAVGFGRQCQEMLRLLETETLEDCATRLPCLAGVALPEFLHESVVVDRLGLLGVTL